MAAVFLDRNANAWWYEDTHTGPLDAMRVQGLERVELPAHVERVQPRDIAEVERGRRADLARAAEDRRLHPHGAGL